MNLVFNYGHQPIISWKGKTFNQITSSIKKNPGLNNTNNKNHNLFLPNPLKIHRREIATPKTVSTCSRRASIKIDEIDRPGGSIINTNVSTTNVDGILNTIDSTPPNNSCEEFSNCTSFMSPTYNARRRLRSAGMVRQKYDSQNRPKYFTNTNQYLTSRNVTYDQNQFRYPISDSKYCVTYNPNNKQFAQQGAVTASSLTARVKYNTINTAAVTTTTELGIATANAMSYGNAENSYTVKNILGFPNKSSYSFKNNLLRKCNERHIRGG